MQPQLQSYTAWWLLNIKNRNKMQVCWRSSTNDHIYQFTTLSYFHLKLQYKRDAMTHLHSISCVVEMCPSLSVPVLTVCGNLDWLK